MTSTTKWTYGGYWRTVLGLGSATDVVREHGLIEAGLDEWLGHAESEAWAIGREGGDVPEEWSTFHARALRALGAAVERMREHLAALAERRGR